MKNLTINGRNYTQSKKALDAYNAPIAAINIDDAYNHPSYQKRAIWNKWEKELTGSTWIKGYNSCTFSIAGITTDEDSGKEYAIFITKDHNYAYEI